MAARMVVLVMAWLVAGVLGPVCDRAEYTHNGDCCPRCVPGERVKSHCTKKDGTTCYPCEEETYLSEPGGEEVCKPCSQCGSGTFPLAKCNVTHDTICDCVEGSHCTDLTSSNCRQCVRHRSCPPGEGVQQPGAYRVDTRCSPCPKGAFSDEDSATQRCRNWTDCAKLQMIESSAGNVTRDAVCSQSWVVLPLSVMASLLVIIGVLVWKRKPICTDLPTHCRRRKEPEQSLELTAPVQEQGQQESGDTASVKLVGNSSVKVIADEKMDVMITLM